MFYFFFSSLPEQYTLVLRTAILSVGPLMNLFQTSGDISPGFQSQGESLVYVLQTELDLYLF